MSKQSGPKDLNSVPNLSSPPVKIIERQPTGFFDIPPDPALLETQSQSAPNSHTGMMHQAKVLSQPVTDDDSEELEPHWFTLPPLQPAFSAKKQMPSAKMELLLDVTNGFLQGLTSLEKLNSGLPLFQSSTSSTDTITRRSSSSKKGSKAEILKTMRESIQDLLIQRAKSPSQFDSEALANSLNKIFETALIDLNKRREFNKETTNLIKKRVQEYIDELKPFKTPSSAPTSTRSSYR